MIINNFFLYVIIHVLINRISANAYAKFDILVTLMTIRPPYFKGKFVPS